MLADQRTPSQVVSDREYLGRVREGIRFLENKYGPGWVDLVNTDTLNLCNGTSCVLGQVAGSYTKAMINQFGPDGHNSNSALQWSRDHGFHLGKTQYPGNRERDWDQLTAVWKREIKQHRNQT